MMRALTVALALCLVAGPAAAQVVPCYGDGAGLIALLEKRWGEDPAVVALDAAGRMIRILVNPETGSWSLLITGPGGPTCLVRHGTAWGPVTPIPDPGDPS